MIPEAPTVEPPLATAPLGAALAAAELGTADDALDQLADLDRRAVCRTRTRLERQLAQVLSA